MRDNLTSLKLLNSSKGNCLIGGKVKYVTTFELDSKSTKSVKSSCMHHIHILDRSGSMWDHIDALMDDVKKTLRMIDDNDYVTVIWFSGAGQYRTVIKCAKNNDKEGLDKILDSLKSTVGCTCFSDPIKELDQIISETSPMCDVYNVTIFTDGEPVTPWSVAEETRRIFENLDVIKDKVIAFNAIGYGNYYNRTLLKKMTETTEYGQVAHASRIEEYSEIFNNNRESVIDHIGKRVNIYAPNSDIVVISPKSVKMYHDKGIVRLTRTSNKVAVITDSESTPVLVEDSVLNKFESEGIHPDYMYAYAYLKYYEGDKDEALDILNLLGDKTLMDRVYNAFTNAEVGELIKFFKDSVFNPELRHYCEVESNTYKPDPNAYCVMDLLRDLVDSGAKYIPTKDYKRVSRKVVDEFNLFVPDVAQKSVDMSGIVLSQDRLNISLRYLVEGYVKLNPKMAQPVGLPNTVRAKIYRTHTIIQDGSLNIPEIRIESHDISLAIKLQDLGIVKEECAYQYLLDLTKLPVINESYLEDATPDKFFQYESRMIDTEAENKVINYFLKDDMSYGEYMATGYTADQVAVLKLHGITSNGVYQAIAPKTQEAEDYNVVREFRTMIKGFSSLPSIDKVVSKATEGKKALTPSESLIYTMYNKYKNQSSEELKASRSVNKKLLKDIRFSLSGSKIALVLTGKWMKGLTIKDDGSWTYTSGDRTLVIKLERKEIPI